MKNYTHNNGVKISVLGFELEGSGWRIYQAVLAIWSWLSSH